MLTKIIKLSLYFIALYLSLAITFVNAKNNTRTSLDFEIIPMHFDLLNSKSHSYLDLEGLIGFELVRDVPQGVKQITLKDEPKLHKLELLAYESSDGKYYVAQVASIAKNVITLTKPLAKDIAKGIHLWNFYNDGSHPNIIGYSALADFAVSQFRKSELDNKVHAFIGDSWFDEGTFEQRINYQVNVLHSINRAVGGRTSSDTLNAFDKDFPVTVMNPDIFWISISTNDYWAEVTPKNYIDNMESIIRKVNAMGAKAYILDSSVGPLDYDDIADKVIYTQKNLSKSYVLELQKLYEDNHSVVINPQTQEPSSGGGTFIFELLVIMGLLFRINFWAK